MKNSIVLILAMLAFFSSSCTLLPKKEKKHLASERVSFQDFQSEIFLPKDQSSKVFVVLIHEWWGKTDFIRERGERVTEEFHVPTLVVDLYGKGKTVTTPAQAQTLATPFYQNPIIAVQRLDHILEETYQRYPHLRERKLVVAGHCFGGTQALNFARVNPSRVSLAVSFHGGLSSTLESVEKNVKTRFVIFHGEADPLVPAKEVDGFVKEMKSLNASSHIVRYPDVLHAFTNPHATSIGREYKLPVAYNKYADEDSWKQFKAEIKKLGEQ